MPPLNLSPTSLWPLSKSVSVIIKEESERGSSSHSPLFLEVQHSVRMGRKKSKHNFLMEQKQVKIMFVDNNKYITFTPPALPPLI